MNIIKPYRDLYDAIGEAGFKEAVAFFRSRGVSSLGYSDKRKHWSFMAMGRDDGPTCVICWVELPAFLAMIEDRAGTLQALWDNGAKVDTSEIPPGAGQK